MPARFLLRENFWKSGGPFIGPRGGKWADAGHKIPWKPEGEKAGMHGLSASQWATAGEHFQNLADKNTGHMASHMNGLAAIAHHYAQGGGDGGASAIYAAKVSESGNPEMANRAHQAVEYIGERAKKLHEAAQGASIPESAPAPEPPKPQIAQVAEAQPGAPKGWVGDPIKTGDHLIVGTHKFVAVTAPQIDEHMTGVMGSKIPYFNVKLKRPAGNKIFEATVSVWNGQPRWRITDKGKPIVGDYSGGGDGHKVVAADVKAPKVESTPTPPIGKAGKVDIPAVPTGMASSWHQRWASGYTTPEPASATFQKTAANYLLKQHEQGMTADDHMEAAKFHSDYGAEVMAGTKFPSLPHKGVRKERMLLHDQLADWHNKMATSPGFIEKLYAAAGRKPKVKKSLNEETDMEKALSGIDDLGEYLEKAGGPFIGPRGGKWADAGHKIPWKEQESDLTRFMDQRKARKWTDAEAAEFKTRQEQLGRAVATEADKLVEEIKGYQSATPAAMSPKDYDDFDTAVGQLRDIHQKLKVEAEVAHKVMQTSGDQGDAELANHLAATLHHVEWALGMKGQSGMLKPPGYQSSNQQAEKSMDAIDQLDDYLEKAFPPPAAPATPGIGPGQAPVPPGGIGGAYTRRWKGPAGKWLYESDHPDHKQAIDASNTAETHPGTAGDLIVAHQNATQAHMKAAQSLKDDPTLSAEHYQVGADHAKAAAIVTTSYMANKAQGAFGAQPGQPPAPGQPMPPPGQPPVAGQSPAPGQPPVPPGQPPLAKGPVPPGQPPVPGQQPGQPPVAKPPVPPPGQFGAQPGQMAPPAPGMPPAQMQPAAGAPQAPQPDPGMKTVPTNPGGGQAPSGPPKPGQPVPEKKENPFQKKEKVKKSMEAIEQLDEYLEKAGYEYPDSVKDKWAVAHRSAIDTSQAAEAAKPGNASVLAHQRAERAHWAAAEQFSHHPDMSGAHMAVSDQHRKVWQGMQKQTSMAAAKGKGAPAAKQVAEFLKKDKVIGKTKDGKPIHSAMSREHYSAASVGWRADGEMRKQRPDYHKYDHRDAAAAHKKEAEQARELSDRLHDEIAKQYGGNVFTKDDETGLYRDEAPEKLRQKLEAIEEYAKTAYDASRNHAAASGNMFAPEEGETYGGVPYQPEERKKSMSRIDALDEYLAKAQSMPEGGPKEKLGTGEEQGGKVDGVGETSGEDDSDSKQPGAPSVPEDVLSDDDDKVSDQLKPGKKPIETAKSMAIHQNQRDMVRKEVAQAVSELRKSQDVEFGRGVAPERSAPAPRPEGIIWNQGADALVSYSNQADLAASELAKSEGFYHGESPQVAPTSLFLSQRVRCTSCHNLMAKSLAVCPSCGDGAQRTLQDVVNTSEHEQLAQGSRAGMLRPARTQGDVYFPGDK